MGGRGGPPAGGAPGRGGRGGGGGVGGGACGGARRSGLVECEVVAPDGTPRWIAGSDSAFSYRDSRFKHDLAGHVIVRGRFTVAPDDIARVRARTDAVQSERKRTQPYGVRSLGSTRSEE